MTRSPAPPLAALVLLAAVAAPSLCAQQPTSLSAGQTVEGPLAPGDTVTYTLEVGDDWWIRGRVVQEGIDAWVRLVDAEGNQRRNLPGRDRGVDRFYMVAEESPGSWELQIVGMTDGAEPTDQPGPAGVMAGATGAGRYRLTLDALEALETDPEALTEQLLNHYDGSDMPGAAVRVWRGGETRYTGAWGMANLAYDIPWSPDTRTNIGSTSKQFTAFAVRLLAERGHLSLDDPVRAYVPELPAFDDTVRVRHLLTHTTGYREIFNLLLMTGRRIGDGDYVGREEVIDVVQAQPALQNAPGAEWNYNNTAFALAALIVERISGQTFPDFMRENLFEPLGMTRTLVRPHAEAIVHERSMGYAPADEGGFREIRDLGAALGAGAIYSTVEDLQRWAENYSEHRVGSAALVDDMTTSFVTTTGDTTGYGLGLFVDEQRGLRRVHHGGADIAHRSMLAMYPEIDAGITVQSNHAGFDSGVAFRLAAAFFADAMEPEESEAVAQGETFDAASYEPEAFDAVTGDYALDANPAFVITLSREGEALYAQATGQQAFELTPTSDTTFALQGLDASLTVVRDGEAMPPEAIVLHQGGQNQRASRVETSADAGWPPSEEALEAFAGRYLSEEVETFFTIRVEDDGEGGAGLILDQRRMGEMALDPGSPDAFVATTPGGPLQIAFERDRAGQVIAFYMSNGRTRDVRFQRIR